MFRKTDTQRSLLECEFLVPPQKAERLKRSWAEPFRQRVLPLIDEEIFRDAFNEATGRPNKSIRLLVCLHILKEWNDLTDEQVLESLEFNLQWHYALGITPDEAHTCQKTLHNFRALLMESRRAQREFERVTKALADLDGVKLGKQRIDSTHVISNIAVLTRLGLFVETVTHFLKELRSQDPDAFASLDSGYARRYLNREGYFSDAKREQAQRRLPVVAQDVGALVTTFETDAAVCEMESFKVLVRLFEEQCEVIDDDDDDGSEGGGGAGGGGPRVQVVDPKTVVSDSLQSPHDPDATYGHKGKGYEVQIAESCDDDNPYQVITGTSVGGAHESDQSACVPMLDQLEASGMAPDSMLADTGYGSGANIVESAKRGVELWAPVQDPDKPAEVEHFTAPVEGGSPQAGSDAADGGATEASSDAADGGQGEEDDEGIAPVETDSDSPLGLESFSFAKTFDEVQSCPEGHEPKAQHIGDDGTLYARFSVEHCTCCGLAARCPTRLLPSGDRSLRRSPARIATEVRQFEQQQPPFKERYCKRSGIEATNQEGKGRHGLGSLRIRGKPRVELAVCLKTLAMNVKRSMQWHVAQMAQMAQCAPVSC